MISPNGGIGCIEISRDHHLSIEGTIIVAVFEVVLELIEMILILMTMDTWGNNAELRISWISINFDVDLVDWRWAHTCEEFPDTNHCVAILEQSGMGCKTELYPGGLWGQIIG